MNNIHIYIIKMNNVFLFRKNEYPEVYNATVADRLPERQPTPQNAFTFRDRSHQQTQGPTGRETKGRPKLSAPAPGRQTIHPTHQANEQTFSKPTLDIKESNDLTELLELVRQDNERRFQENENEMKLIARGDKPGPDVKNELPRYPGYPANMKPEHKTHYDMLWEEEDYEPFLMTGGARNKNCYKVIAKEKDGMDCYTVMTGGAKKNITNLENAIAMVKANGYTLFKSKLAQGAKRIRKSRAKSKF
jgi:hypothetical protein